MDVTYMFCTCSYRRRGAARSGWWGASGGRRARASRRWRASQRGKDDGVAHDLVCVLEQRRGVDGATAAMTTSCRARKRRLAAKKKIEDRVRRLRTVMGKRRRPERGGSVCNRGRRRWRNSAARRSSGEEIRRTRRTIQRGRRGEMERRPRASHRNKRRLIWWCKSSAINLGRGDSHWTVTDVRYVLRLKMLMTSSIFLFLYFCFLLYLLK